MGVYDVLVKLKLLAVYRFVSERFVNLSPR
jgi:hypothetical protein